MAERRSGKERRRQARARKRFPVQFGPGELAHAGYTMDIADDGVCLQADVIFPPGTILALRVEFPEGPWTTHGRVRWSKDLPPAFKRSLRGRMGIEFLEATTHSVAVPPSVRTESAPPPSSPPPAVSDQELGHAPTHRRQMSTPAGNTYEVFQSEYRGAWFVRIFQLPLTDGSAEAAFRGGFWTREAAEAAVRDFLKQH